MLLFGRGAQRLFAFVAVMMLVLGVVLSGFYFLSPRASLRMTSGFPGTAADKFVKAFVAGAAARYRMVKVSLVPVQSYAESSKALENGKADIAIVRTDIAPPSNGATVAILRRDAVVLVVGPGSRVKSPADLIGKTIAIPQSPVQDDNSRLLDQLLAYFDIAPDKVKRVFLPVAETGAAIQRKHAAAVLAVGPIGPGEAVNVVTSIAKATRGTPKILEFDEADAIAKRFPGFESIDIPAGAFRGRPEVPDDTVTSVAVTYRIVVPQTMLDVIAGMIGKSIIDTKDKLMASLPMVSQIEAPDTDNPSPILPVHSGVANYFNSGDQSFLDSLQQYFYVIGIPLSFLGSLGAVFFGQVQGRKMANDQKQIYQLLVYADAARTADAAELDRLEAAFNAAVTDYVNRIATKGGDPGQAPISSLAIDHARRAFDRRRMDLREQKPTTPGPAVGQAGADKMRGSGPETTAQ
ncbi:TAXI family TRAP transporter solute-binding subunit [Rhodoblastus sp.]|uniref:TAXI family TRAP transporter solute-binding subunit n=1 Tax=Rhodoblastus sp. TaxID=1962975 RepID=UPI003F98F122